jgi:hypothetical protein
MTASSFLTRRVGLLLSCVLTAISALAETIPISVQGTLDAIIPANLRSLQIDHPYVDFKIDLGADGTLFDAMAIESNHRDLLPAAHKVLQSVTFVPATKDGRPIRQRANIRVRFYDPSQRAWRTGANMIPFSDTPSEAARRRIYSNSASNFFFELSTKEELDSPLTQLLTTRRIYSSQSGVSTKGKCVVEFYVGPNGRARFPRALESDSDDVALSAALTLLKSRFEPPRRNGHPTYVKIQQDFEFR